MIDLTNNLIKIPPTAVAIGFFDGLHLGHQAVIKETFCHSGLKPAIFTFHSETALPKRENMDNILSNEIKIEKLSEMGLEYIYSPDFNSVRHYSAVEFIENILIRILNTKVLVCGFDFRLGNGAGTNAQELKTLCAGYEIKVVVIPPFSCDGKIVHSTGIKQLIKFGEIHKANKLLGYDFCIDAKVIKGSMLGRQLDSPTINQLIPQHTIIPCFGVYKSVTVINGKEYPSITNLGVKPTVSSEKKPIMETNILNVNEDLYGQTLRVRLQYYLREEKKFDSIDSLKKQIQLDRENAAGINIEDL